MNPLTVTRLCVLSLLILLASCGGGSDSSENIIVDPPAPPQDGIGGSAASRIRGGRISIQDANGDDVVVASGRTTNESGSYRLVFSEFEILEGITPPLLLTLDGTGATAVCDFDQEGDNDCLTREGNFASYGETYNLPDGFSLRALAPTYPPESESGDRLINVNFSAASDLAAALAIESSAGGTLDRDLVELANQQAMGFVEFTSGLSSSGLDINSIANLDLPVASSTPTPALALALFNASLHGQVNTEVSNVADYRRVLNRMTNQVNATATGNLRSMGSYLSQAMTAFVTGSTAYQASLATPSAVLAGAIASRQIPVRLLEQTGSGTVDIALPADPASSDALDRGRTMISRLSEVMGSTLLISTTPAFGGTREGAALVYSDQVALIATLVSRTQDDLTTQQLYTGNQYTVVSGESTVMADLVTNVITDMNASLNLNLDSDGLVTGGTLTATDEAVGSMTAGGSSSSPTEQQPVCLRPLSDA